MRTQPATQPAEQSVFHTVLARLTALNIHCETETHGSETYASYAFADDTHLTWGAFSNTGAENAFHPASAHGHLAGFHAGSDRDTSGDFTTGDYATDADALIAWITALVEQHGHTPQ